MNTGDGGFMAFATVNGIELYYEVHGRPVGEAEAIVFAHGAGGSHLSWWQQVPYFAAKYTCVTFDHRTYGQSVDVPGGPGGAAFTDDLRGLLDHLGIERANLVAQSMGGWTCLGLALRSPERVKRLVMADTHGGLRSPEIAEAMKRATGLDRSGVPANVHPAAGVRMAREQPALAFLYSQMDGLNRVRSREELGALIGATGSPTAEEAAKLDLPVLFLSGEEDMVIPPAVVEAAAKCVPGARFVQVPKAGHSVYFERPDVFNELVGGFLGE
ncbi:MAG: alpha/beta hydrolase [Tepidiformaceae bacterium]